MKKIISSILVAGTMLSMSACALQSTETMPPTSATTTVETTVETTEPSPTPSPTPTPNPNFLGGKLYILSEKPVVSGVVLKGNVAGSEDFNKRTMGDEDIRCVFELNEHIEINITNEGEEAVTLYVLKHNNNKFTEIEYSDEMTNYVTSKELEYDEDAKNYGSFYLNPEDCEAGIYDFVFVVDGKAVANMYVKIYKEQELVNKTDEELNKLIETF